MLEFNLEMTEKVILHFIREQLSKNRFKKAVIGVSGGVDSAVVLYLLQRAIGSANILALLLPYKLSSRQSLADGKKICDLLSVKYQVVDISPSVDAYFKQVPSSDRILLGNKCARERMSILYDFSSREKALVAGTSNKSEILIGYTTLYGDSAAAFMPLGDLYKTQVFRLADYLGVISEIFNKRPSADLWKGQTDEGEIGITYRILDEILYQLVDQRKNDQEIARVGYKISDIKKIKEKMAGSHFKRTLPPVVKLQLRSVGHDFRYARDWNK